MASRVCPQGYTALPSPTREWPAYPKSSALLPSRLILKSVPLADNNLRQLSNALSHDHIGLRRVFWEIDRPFLAIVG